MYNNVQYTANRNYEHITLIETLLPAAGDKADNRTKDSYIRVCAYGHMHEPSAVKKAKSIYRKILVPVSQARLPKRERRDGLFRSTRAQGHARHVLSVGFLVQPFTQHDLLYSDDAFFAHQKLFSEDAGEDAE